MNATSSARPPRPYRIETATQKSVTAKVIQTHATREYGVNRIVGPTGSLSLKGHYHSLRTVVKAFRCGAYHV